MKKKKIVVGVGVLLCIALIAIASVFIFKKEDIQESDKVDIAGIKERFQTDIQSLKEGKYNNLIYNDFEASIAEVEGVYNIEIQTDTAYRDRTFLENFSIMNDVIDEFFLEEFDKSYLVVDFHISDEETIYVGYNDIEKECVDEKYNMPRAEFLFGNETSNGGYMVQIAENLNNAWFSKGGLGDIGPFNNSCNKVYPYISCIRQNEEVEINLKDGKINLSELEKDVLNYLNGNFPLSVSEKITLGIGEVRILNMGDYEGVSFNIRRIYKGVPFEYGTLGQSGMYIDYIGADTGNIAYAESTGPDTLLGFGRINGKVTETEIISEIITLGKALDILSAKIGENSTYDVYGVELVYRNQEIPQERENEVDDILVPKWKIITINKNDDKYTLFYVDAVTGKITERFEYYYG